MNYDFWIYLKQNINHTCKAFLFAVKLSGETFQLVLGLNLRDALILDFRLTAAQEPNSSGCLTKTSLLKSWSHSTQLKQEKQTHWAATLQVSHIHSIYVFHLKCFCLIFRFLCYSSHNFHVLLLSLNLPFFLLCPVIINKLFYFLPDDSYVSSVLSSDLMTSSYKNDSAGKRYTSRWDWPYFNQQSFCLFVLQELKKLWGFLKCDFCINPLEPKNKLNRCRFQS